MSSEDMLLLIDGLQKLVRKSKPDAEPTAQDGASLHATRRPPWAVDSRDPPSSDYLARFPDAGRLK
jgi:hypothetical protein